MLFADFNRARSTPIKAYRSPYTFVGVVLVGDVQLGPAVRPRTELQLARLDVEREVLDVDRAGRAEDGGRKPQDDSRVRDDGHGISVLLQPLVGAETRARNTIHNEVPIQRGHCCVSQ